MSDNRNRKKEVWVISNDNLEVVFHAGTGAVSVWDKRVNKKWEQLPFKGGFVADKVYQDGNILSMELVGPFTMTVVIELTERSELVYHIAAKPDVPMEKLYFPSAFVTPDKDHYLLETDSEGVLLPADDTVYPLEEQPLYFCGGGPAMSWIGVVDREMAAGYMAIVETPYDAAILPGRENGLITFSPVWLGSMRRFSYERRVRYVFFDRGGYVAQCKRYREYIWPLNHVVTLKEKEKRFPAVKKMLGAVHIYVWDKAREVSFAKEMKEAGIDKAMILWNPNHRPYPEEGYDNRLKELGYCSGVYELFTDILEKSHPGNLLIQEVPLKRNVYPGKFDSITSRKKDGSTYTNQYGTFVCPEAVRPQIKLRVEKERKLYPHEACFLDVYQANGLYECYEPEHRLTRSQYAESIIRNYKLLEDEYGMFLGGEFGADFAGSYGIFVHGMMTLQRIWWYQPDANEPGTIYYMGDWKNHSRTTIMLGERTATDGYRKYSINESLRVPLYELVYHDAVVASWRWEDCNHHNPEIWWKKDLFNILYGSAPLWSIDQDRWEAFRTTFVESYHKICPWLQQICYDELISHRFVSEDRKVQESLFSSGRSVAVNFGDEPYPLNDRIIPARGYMISLEGWDRKQNKA